MLPGTALKLREYIQDPVKSSIIPDIIDLQSREVS